MSGSPFYDVAQKDSQNLKHLAQDWNWGFLEDEAVKNEKNPGRAIGKAAGYALGGYLLGPGEAAAEGAAATTAGEAALEAGITAGSEAAATQAIEQAIAQQAAQYGGEAASQGLLETAKGAISSGKNAMTDGWNSMKGLLSSSNPAGAQTAGQNMSMETGLLDTGYTPSSLKYAFQNANSANGTPLAQNLLNYAKGPSGKAAAGNMQQALKLQQAMQPQQQPPPPRPSPPPPRPQEPQGPLTSPYAQNPFGPGGNSMGLLNLPEEEKKRLRAMGYRV